MWRSSTPASSPITRISASSAATTARGLARAANDAPSSRWRDDHGHGTHVAGIVGALDNTRGVVGVAPGVRLWAVRVFTATGYSRISWIACGIDWVTSKRTSTGRPLIKVPT